jgi:hypothetical protein
LLKVALLGKGSLAKAFIASTKHQIKIFSRPEIDFWLQSSVKDWVRDVANNDVIINTIGINKGDLATIMQVNYFTPVLLLDQLRQIDYQGKVIFLGSHGATWTSWPGIDSERLNYNVSKANLKTYMMSLSQSGLVKYKICLFDSTKFQSQMSDFQGDDISEVAKLLEYLIDTNTPDILNIETY